MATAMARYTLYIPLNHNDGSLATRPDLAWLIESVARFAGGCTQLAPSTGWWVAPDGTRYVDRILALEVVAPATAASDAFFSRVAAELAVRLAQEAVFLLAVPVNFVTVEDLGGDTLFPAA